MATVGVKGLKLFPDMRIRIFAWICPWTIIFLLHIADAGDQQTRSSVARIFT